MLLLCKWYIIWLMNKEKFIALAGSQNELAKLLGISQAAVSQWKTVPQARVWQLKLLRPDWFLD
jgi:transcriptional regulator with XRE-family HTH domain